MEALIETAKRILADPDASEWHKTAARETLEDFISGRNDHPFSVFVLPMDDEEEQP